MMRKFLVSWLSIVCAGIAVSGALLLEWWMLSNLTWLGVLALLLVASGIFAYLDTVDKS